MVTPQRSRTIRDLYNDVCAFEMNGIKNKLFLMENIRLYIEVQQLWYFYMQINVFCKSMTFLKKYIHLRDSDEFASYIITFEHSKTICVLYTNASALHRNHHKKNVVFHVQN